MRSRGSNIRWQLSKKTHLQIHIGKRPFSCSMCGVRCRHSWALTGHFSIHTREGKLYVCAECGKSLRKCGRLHYHQKSHHPEVHALSISNSRMYYFVLSKKALSKWSKHLFLSIQSVLMKCTQLVGISV